MRDPLVTVQGEPAALHAVCQRRTAHGRVQSTDETRERAGVSKHVHVAGKSQPIAMSHTQLYAYTSRARRPSLRLRCGAEIRL